MTRALSPTGITHRAIRLDTAAAQTLTDIAGYLQKKQDMLALGLVSKRVHAVLDAGALAPIRLSRAIRRAQSCATLQRLWQAATVLGAPARATLSQQVAGRISALHPALHDAGAMIAPHSNVSTSVAIPACSTLEAALAVAPARRRMALTLYMHRRADELPRRTPAQWMAIADALPAHDRAPFLQCLAFAVREQAPGTARAWLHAWHDVLGRHRSGVPPEHCGQDLATLARLLVASSPMSTNADDPLLAERLSIWDAIHAAALAVPAHAAKPAIVALAPGVAIEFRAGSWTRAQSLIRTARDRYAPADAGDILVAMATPLPGHWPWPAPAVLALTACVDTLPPPQQASLCGAIANVAPDEDTLTRAWQAMLAACQAAAPSDREPMIRALATYIAGGPEFVPDDMADFDRAVRARWNALLAEVSALSITLRHRATLALIDASTVPAVRYVDESASAVPHLLALATPLSAAERAGVIARLAASGHAERHEDWGRITNAAAALPPESRYPALLVIARRMLGFAAAQENAGLQWTGINPGPPFATQPLGLDDAATRLRPLLDLLPAAHRHRLAAKVCRHMAHRVGSWSSVLFSLLVHEVDAMPFTHACKAGAVTDLAHWAARRCPADDRAVLSELKRIVDMLPPEDRASALYWTADAAARHGASDMLREIRAAIAQLPEPDRTPLAPSGH